MNAVTKRNPEFREQIKELERHMAAFDAAECPIEHYFAHGTYTRLMHAKAGTLLTGKVHRHSCVNILTKGKLMIASDEGDYSVDAPNVFISGGDVRKAIYALEDSILINVHPWDGKEDLEQIEARVIDRERLEAT
jgi:hypothetical protein